MIAQSPRRFRTDELMRKALEIMLEEGGGKITKKTVDNLSRMDFAVRKIRVLRTSFSGLKYNLRKKYAKRQFPKLLKRYGLR